MLKCKEAVPIVALSVVVTLLMGAILILFVLSWVERNPDAVRDLLNHYLVSDIEKREDPTHLVTDAEKSIVEVVRAANPAVVAITVSKDVPTYERYFRDVPSPFGDFFNFQIPDIRQNGTERRDIGGGSGFIVSSDGYIVTNRHVVSENDAQYTVFTNDGETHEADVIARDSSLDIAILKIDGTDFPYLSFGDSDQVEIGQTVIAIGNALAEFRNTVSVGVVSGLARSIVAGDGMGNAESLDTLIQTDAAINPGNSGGPLLSSAGEVIGVNVAIAGNAENIGFALPGNSVESVVESVQEHGKIVRPYIGVRYVQVTKELKEKNALSVDYGILVVRGDSRDELAVMPGSPADRAGIVENDIILELDGKKITEDVSFASLIREKRVGDTVELKLLHRGEEKVVTVHLAEMPQG